jgi:8-oxo-dGTP diphosphatase
MIHRIKKKNDIHQDKWNGLGGKFQAGESPEECIIREVEEESGLTIRHPFLKGFLTFPSFSHGEDWYVFVFIAREYEGTLIDSAEGHLEWVRDDYLPRLNLWEGDRLFFEWFKEGTFFSGKLVYEQGKLVDHNVHFYKE